jgi:hypothetical protein
MNFRISKILSRANRFNIPQYSFEVVRSEKKKRNRVTPVNTLCFRRPSRHHDLTFAAIGMSKFCECEGCLRRYGGKVVSDACWYLHNPGIRKRPRKGWHQASNGTRTGRIPSLDVGSGPSRRLNVRESSEDVDPTGINSRAARSDQVRTLC